MKRQREEERHRRRGQRDGWTGVRGSARRNRWSGWKTGLIETEREGKMLLIVVVVVATGVSGCVWMCGCRECVNVWSKSRTLFLFLCRAAEELLLLRALSKLETDQSAPSGEFLQSASPMSEMGT
eukprot:Gregarina_sp_Pseudo_9__4267@NODE_441_length_2823_cov_121_625718_g417_i0_p6_GENE_NODE_441_length_2823_cov_121_625718_g417_i0NODE_441_length_2823_cov_121_625718_g417_i0_p6_ORF_typecomplete_len125_score5_78_NODE_441_length_2823_cov_121_625718_g417_i017742148